MSIEMLYNVLIAFVVFLVIVIILAAIFWNAGCGVDLCGAEACQLPCARERSNVCDRIARETPNQIRVNGQMLPVQQPGQAPIQDQSAILPDDAGSQNWADAFGPGTNSLNEPLGGACPGGVQDNISLNENYY